MSQNLPARWTWAKAQELAAPEKHSLGIGPFGSNLKVSDYSDSGVPLVFVRNIRAESFDGNDVQHVTHAKAADLLPHKVHPGDVLVTKMGDPPGDSALYPASSPVGIVTADCIRWRIDPRLGTPSFFVYATRSLEVRQQILGITTGVAQRKMSASRFKSVLYPLAPPSEQHRVVEAIESYFSRLNDAEATLERVQRNLERYRASVLKAAVEGRLVPTEAELARTEGRDYEPASALLERILTERRRRWEKAQLARLQAKGKPSKNNNWKAKYTEPPAPEVTVLPPLPEGWCWSSVGQLGDVTGGLTQNAKRSHLELQLPFLRVGNVYANELWLDDVKTIGVHESEVERARLVKDDMLIVEGNGSLDQIGRVALWDGSVEPCVHQNHLIKVRFYPSMLAHWVLCWLLSPLGRAAIERIASSTSGLHTLSLSKVSKLPVPLPPAAEQARVIPEVERASSVPSATALEVEGMALRCARLRQSILKWAFHGRLVDQDRSDEPASELLHRIRAERASTKKGRTGGRRQGKARATKK